MLRRRRSYAVSARAHAPAAAMLLQARFAHRVLSRGGAAVGARNASAARQLGGPSPLEAHRSSLWTTVGSMMVRTRHSERLAGVAGQRTRRRDGSAEQARRHPRHPMRRRHSHQVHRFRSCSHRRGAGLSRHRQRSPCAQRPRYHRRRRARRVAGCASVCTAAASGVHRPSSWMVRRLGRLSSRS